MNILFVLFIFRFILNIWIVIFSSTFYHSACVNLEKKKKKKKKWFLFKYKLNKKNKCHTYWSVIILKVLLIEFVT